MENVPKTPVIVCMNHLGWAEGFLVMLFLPPEPRIYGLGERDVVTRTGARVIVANWLEVFIPLDRNKPREAIRLMQDVLERGGSLMIAPEGHLGDREGTIAPLQDGAAYLSVRTGVPLLPVGATGTLELWWRKTLTLRIGNPISPGVFEGDTRTRTHAMTECLEHEMRALLPGDDQHPKYKPLRDWLTKLF